MDVITCKYNFIVDWYRLITGWHPSYYKVFKYKKGIYRTIQMVTYTREKKTNE